MLTSDSQLFCLSLPTARISGIYHICLDFLFNLPFLLLFVLDCHILAPLPNPKEVFFFLYLLLGISWLWLLELTMN